MRRAADLLARLRRHEVDQQRLAVAAAASELERVRNAIAAEQHRYAAEHARAFELPGGPRPLAPFAAAVHDRCRALATRADTLEGRLEAARATLRNEVRRWKSLDLAVAALRAAEAADLAGRERRALEEAALLRRAGLRTRGPASPRGRPAPDRT